MCRLLRPAPLAVPSGGEQLCGSVTAFCSVAEPWRPSAEETCLRCAGSCAPIAQIAGANVLCVNILLSARRKDVNELATLLPDIREPAHARGR